MQNEKEIYWFSSETLPVYAEMLHIRNHKIIPVPCKCSINDNDNEWQQEYKSIYDSYIIDGDED